jgi:hypothetical protein
MGGAYAITEGRPGSSIAHVWSRPNAEFIAHAVNHYRAALMALAPHDDTWTGDGDGV